MWPRIWSWLLTGRSRAAAPAVNSGKVDNLGKPDKVEKPDLAPVEPLSNALRLPETQEAAPIAAPSSVPAAAVDLVAKWEGFRAAAYLCPAQVWTVGYGSTRWGDGRAVQPDDTIDEASARRLLMRDLAEAAAAVDALVKVPLSAGQRAALVSFVYNVGRGAFSRSTMLMHLNAGRMDSAAGEFARWCKGGGIVLSGLVKRRAEEAALFSS
jgi:lysozyme